MIDRKQLYDAFGELVYALVMTDEHITDEELASVRTVLEGHEGAKEIKWSFEHEKSGHTSPEEAYTKAMGICKKRGPDREYAFLLDILDQIATDCEFDETKEEFIRKFQDELRQHFIDEM